MKQFVPDFSALQSQFLNVIQAYLPKIAMALILLVIGWLISRLLSLVVQRAVKRLQHWGEPELTGRDSPLQFATPKAIGSITFWVVFLLFVASAVQMLGLPVVSSGLNKLAGYLPNLIVAILVIVGGIILGNMLRAAITSTAKTAKISYAATLGETARVTVLTLATMIALTQIGIDSTVLIVAFGLVVGGTIGGSALAFGFGARTAVSNLIAGRNVTKNFQTGQPIRIGNISGRILQITPSMVILQTDEGQAQIPAKVFEETTTILLSEEV